MLDVLCMRSTIHNSMLKAKLSKTFKVVASCVYGTYKSLSCGVIGCIGDKSE